MVAAASAIALSIVLALVRAWPFGSRPPPVTVPSIMLLLLNDRLTVGFLRLALVALALFVIGSVPALIVADRWLVGFGASGVVADAAQEA